MSKNKELIILSGLINSEELYNIVFDEIGNNTLLIDFNEFNFNILDNKKELYNFIEEHLINSNNNFTDEKIIINIINNRAFNKTFLKILDKIKKEYDNTRKGELKIKAKHYFDHSIDLFNIKKYNNISNQYFSNGVYLGDIATLKKEYNKIDFQIIDIFLDKEYQNNNKIDNEILNFLSYIESFNKNEDKEIIKSKITDFLYNGLMKKDNVFKLLKDFKQTSKNHLETLGEHIILIISNIIDDYNKGLLTSIEKDYLIIIALFHDIGKPIARRVKINSKRLDIDYDEELENINDITNKEEILSNKKYTFYDHDNISAYIFYMKYAGYIENKIFFNSRLITNIIYYHILGHDIINDIINGKVKKNYNINNEKISLNKIKEIKEKYILNKVKLPINNDLDNLIKYTLLFEKYDSIGRIRL